MNNTQQFRLRDAVNGVVSGALVHFDTAMTVVDYLQMLATMDVDTKFNPRNQNLSGAQVASMLDTLEYAPGQFYSGNKGVRIAGADRLRGPSGDWIVGPLHIYDGAHTTLAVVAYTLSHLGVSVSNKTTLSDALKMLRKLHEDGLLNASNLPDDFVLECKIPARFTCASSPEALVDGSYEVALRSSAKNTNTTVAVSKQGLFFNSASGMCLLKYVNTGKTITHKDDRAGVTGLSSDIIVRLATFLLSVLPTTNTGVEYGKKKFNRVSGPAACHSVVRCTAYVQNILDRPGVISPSTLQVSDKNIHSLLSMLPDLMLGSDMLYNTFERLFNNPRGKSISPKLIGGGAGTQTTRRLSKTTAGLHMTKKTQSQTDCYKFGLVPVAPAAEGVTYTMIAPLLCAMRELIDYDQERGFYWVVTPATALTDHVDLLAALLNNYSKAISKYMTKASLLRHIHESSEHNEIAERAFGRIKELAQLKLI